MKKICIVVTAEFAVKAFLINHIRKLSEIYDVSVIVNTANIHFLNDLGVNAKIIPLAIKREIDLMSDLICLFKLIRIFIKEHFSAVQSVTPKAGLLAMFAAWLSFIPLRIHAFTGQVWSNKNGLKRIFLKQFDKLIAFFATHNIVDSESQRQFLLKENVINLRKSILFGKGSISGVDLSRFKPNQGVRLKIRQQLKIPTDSVVFLFLGRLNVDKGVLDLASAIYKDGINDAHLIFVGPDEQEMQGRITTLIKDKINLVHFVGHSTVPEHFMAAADVICLPSYREGFGSVLIEAAAVGIPAIASRIYGITDAVIEGETGLLHPPHDIDAIIICMHCLAKNQSLRFKMGEQARARAIEDFDSKIITQQLVNFYRTNLLK